MPQLVPRTWYASNKPILLLAECHGLERDDLDAELLLELENQILGVERAIEVIATLVLASRVVTPHNHVRAAVVLADKGVLQCFTWAADL